MEFYNEDDSTMKKESGIDEKKYHNLGLTTVEAIKILYKEISAVLEENEKDYKKNMKYKEWLRDSLHHRSRYTTFCWTSAVALLLSATGLIFTFFIENETEFSFLPFEGLLVLFMVVLNFLLVITDNKFRHYEIPYRIKNMLSIIEAALKEVQWNPENYPHLRSPFSPCLTLQWTYRDGNLINLPWALLVVGDIIVIKPGQQSPGHCSPCDDIDGPVLNFKDIYAPQSHNGISLFSSPRARVPLKNRVYKLLETPYLTNLRLALEQSLDRPTTYHNRARHLFMICCIEQFIYPILVLVIAMCNIVRYIYLRNFITSGHWTDMFILQPIAVTIPLLPITFPFWWIVLNNFGMARFKALFQLYQSTKTKQLFDPFEDVSDPNHPEVVYNWNELSEYFWDNFLGKENMLTRSANILHVLGSVTALCCIDKKGILSWPNPTAEKVFFLRNASPAVPNADDASKASSNASLNKLTEQNPQNVLSNGKKDRNKSPYTHQELLGTVAEVLDLTHDRNLPFKLQFDDQSWRQHINSLKPLGLAILLNTCNMETQEHYTQFCSHVTCEALQNEHLVPVINRRCLCELAKQIGFKDQATDIFHLEHQLSTFRHVPDASKRDIKFARSLSIATKLKFPFPHMVGVVVKEKYGGGSQLLTQGTADIILDSCVDFWDGHDLYPLSESDKRKVQDFYNRMSLTSYCTAFAYRPLHKNIAHNVSNIYLELPSESRHLYCQHRSPTPLSWDVLDPRCKSVFGQFHSTDSLLCNESKEEEVNSIEGIFELQCNQIFIGIVTMQYQAQADMVQLIEQLERACIRFVHFSKENELRSRVFSEKLGLESGWNCHISLLSERARSESPVGWWVSQTAAVSPSPSVRSHQAFNHSCMDEASRLLNSVSPRSTLDNSRILSMSAPSAINTELATVRFENESTDCGRMGAKSQAKSVLSHRDQQTERSDDSVLVQSVDLGSGHEAWRSLSCLTDSTEQSAPVNFDLSNNAKLPRGIEKIRPHIESIDNVPLLVSLFTDCTTDVTREMLHIMQDYGEVVCVLGSSANAENMPIFLQADAAIGLEPLYPQVCQSVPVFIATQENQGISPVDLSRTLNSVACSLSMKREDPIAIYHFIMEARHFMQCLWNCVQFWLCCVVTVSFAQAMSVFFLLPPLFTVGQVLWLICLIIPILSISMIGTPTDPTVMQRATEKNQCTFNGQIALFVLWCYGFKFCPVIVSIVLWQFVSLWSLCSVYSQTSTDCFYIYPNATSDISWGGWELRPDVIHAVQHFAVGLIVIHFVITSVSFVHREYAIWQKLPFHNWFWFLISIIVLCVQSGFSGISFYNFWIHESNSLKNFPTNLPLFFLASIPVLLITNEIVKWQEVKVNIRHKKRARLEFTTKLGMNSPFV